MQSRLGGDYIVDWVLGALEPHSEGNHVVFADWFTGVRFAHLGRQASELLLNSGSAQSGGNIDRSGPLHVALAGAAIEPERVLLARERVSGDQPKFGRLEINIATLWAGRLDRCRVHI